MLATTIGNEVSTKFKHKCMPVMQLDLLNVQWVSKFYPVTNNTEIQNIPKKKFILCSLQLVSVPIRVPPRANY